MWMYGEDTIYLDTDEGGGADGSSDDGGEEGSDDGVEEEGAEEGAAEEGAKGTGPKPGSKRWNKIYARSKVADTYEGYGTPAEIAQKFARLELLDQKIEGKEDAGESDDKETKDLKERQSLIRKQLREVEPALEHLEELQEYAADMSESLRERAADACREAMEESGIEVNDKSYGFFARSLNSIIKGDRRLYLIYLTSPEKAVEKAYEEYARPFQADGKREKGAALVKQGAALRKLPKQVKQGSSSAPVKKVKEAQDVKEAEKQFLEMFEAAQED